MTPVEVAPGVHRLGSEFVNWYLIEADDGIVAVDGGFPGYAQTLDADLAALGHSLGDVRAVVLTHGDSDHTGLVPTLTGRGAPVHMHAGDAGLVKPHRKKTEASPLPYLLRSNAPRRFVAHALRVGGAKPVAIPNFEPIEDGEEVEGTSLRAIHTPGHTDGHCVLLLADRGVLFAGDQLSTFNPLTGREGAQIPARGSNMDSAATMSSLDRLDELPGEVVLCGHGDPYRGSPAAAAADARAAGES